MPALSVDAHPHSSPACRSLPLRLRPPAAARATAGIIGVPAAALVRLTVRRRPGYYYGARREAGGGRAGRPVAPHRRPRELLLPRVHRLPGRRRRPHVAVRGDGPAPDADGSGAVARGRCARGEQEESAHRRQPLAQQMTRGRPAGSEDDMFRPKR
jgi:hypothetical protein